MENILNMCSNGDPGQRYEDEFKYMFMCNPTLMWIFDADSLDLLDVNDAALQCLGYQKEEFLFMNQRVFIREPNLDTNSFEIKDGDLNGNSGIFWHKNKDGKVIFMEIVSHRFSFDGRPAYHVMAVDITQKRKIEESLKNSEERFKIVIEGIPTPVIIQVDSTVVYANSKAQELFNAPSQSDIIGKNLFDLVHPDFHEIGRNRIKRILELRESVLDPVEMKFITIHGTEVWVESVGQPIEYSGKQAAMVFIKDITSKKKIEEDIKYQEYLLKEMGRIAMIGGWEFDPVSGQGSWSEEVSKIHGIDPEDKTSKELGLSFYTPESRDRIEQAINNTLKYQIPYDLELEIILKNDVHKWVHTFGQPVMDGEKITRLRGAFQDITQRKLGEKALIESEAKYRSFFENSMDAMMVTTPDGGIISVNEAACQLFGYSKEELKQIGIDGIIDISDNELELFVEKRRKTGLAKAELAFIRKDRQKIYTEITSAIFTDASDQQKTSMIIRDITARKEAEQALISSKEQYKRLLELAPVGIAVINDHRISYINPAGTRLLGAENSNQLVNKLINEFTVIDPDHDPINNCTIGKKRKFPRPQEWLMDGLDNRSMVAEVMISPLEYEGKTGCQIIFSDITERINAKKDIMQLNAELEQHIAERTSQLTAVNKDLESFAYSVSHDLRAPLRGINGLTQLLQEKYAGKLDEDGHRLCDKITANSLKMGKLIEDLLEFSKASTSDVHKLKVDMNKLVKNAMREVCDKEESRNIVDFEIGNLPTVHGDSILLEQVWINLISNSIKFTSKKEQPLIQISGFKEGNVCTYVIRDNGAGFNMTYASKLFSVFQRLHSEQEFQGTGAGLAIVQRVILKHGGKIWAEGEEQKGATFHFTLPA